MLAAVDRRLTCQSKAEEYRELGAPRDLGSAAGVRATMPQDTALHKAAYKGDIGGVVEAIDIDKIAVDEPGAQDRTALQRACGAAQTRVVEELLKRGASVVVGDKSGRTALHWAAVSGDAPCIDVILSHGAGVNTQTAGGYTALHMAADAGHATACRMLQDKGADLALVNSEGQTAGMLAKAGGHNEVAKALGVGGGCVLL